MSRELLQQALDALKPMKDSRDDTAIQRAIAALEAELAKPEQEPVAWRNAAIRLGEDLYSVGPNGYYDMTAKQWLDWALSVVNTAQPEKEPYCWVQSKLNQGLFYKEKPRRIHTIPLFTASPPKREWVGLTDDEVYEIANFCKDQPFNLYAKEIENKLRSKNAV